MKKTRKIVSTLLLTCTLMGSFYCSALASDGQYVEFSYKNHSVPGSVDGSSNKRFYKLTSGKVHLGVTETSSTSSNSIKVELRRSKLGIDAGYGAHTIDGIDNYYWNVDTNSSNNYLFAYGGATNTVQYLKGYMYNY